MSQVPRHLKKRPGIAGTVVPAVTSRRAMVTTGAVVSLPAAGGMVASSPAFALGSPQQGAGIPQQGVGAEAVAGAQTLATPKTSVRASSSDVVVLHYGSRGKYVRILQGRLGGLAVDGSFGPATLAKVKSFQRHHGLRVDGYVGPATWRALGGFPRGGSSTPSCYVHVLRYGATGSLVRTAQRRLGHLGVDGSFGPATLRRVKSFQRSHGLAVDGVIGPATWGALGGYPCGSDGGGGGGSRPPSGPGDPSAHYRLPFPSGDTFKITQGPHGRYSHNTAYNKTAVDVGMPIGTPVLAARAGTVQATGYTSAGGGRYVLIKDASGLCQVYFHLSRYRVAPGQRVAQGQRVASSGNSGDSTGPHLHFDLLHCSTWKSAKIMPTVARGTSYPTGTYITSHN